MKHFFRKMLWLFLFIVFPFFLASCSDNAENNPINPDVNFSAATNILQINTSKKFDKDKIEYYRQKYKAEDFKEIALLLSKALSDKKTRMDLKESINKSTYVEQILEGSEYLNKKSGTSGILEKMLNHVSTDKKFNFKNKIENLDFGIVDIYFPIKEHRSQWNGDENLLIAYVDSKILKNNESILAYDLHGKTFLLNPKEKPSLPTLVVTPSEKLGQYSNMMLPPPDDGGGGGGGGGGGTLYWKYITQLEEIYIKTNQDPPLGGAMEIYLKIRVDAGNGYSIWWNIPCGDMYVGSNAISQELYAHTFPNPDVVPSYKFQIEIWEEDDIFFTGDDDQVSDVSYNFLRRKEYGSQTYNWLVINNASFSEIFFDAPYSFKILDGWNADSPDSQLIISCTLSSFLL